MSAPANETKKHPIVWTIFTIFCVALVAVNVYTAWKNEKNRTPKGPSAYDLAMESAKQTLATLPDNPNAAVKLNIELRTGAVDSCIEHWRSSFREPKSAEFSGGMNILRRDGFAMTRTMIVEVRARNGFGGMGTTLIACDFNEDGGVSQFGTERIRKTMNQAAIDRMMRSAI